MRSLTVTVLVALSLVGYGDRVAVAQTSTSPAFAQIIGALHIPPYAPASSRGRFLPFRAGHVDLCEMLSPEEEQRMLGVLRRLDQVFRRAPVLNPPAGVEIRPNATVGGITPDQCRERLRFADVRYQIFKPTVAIAGESQGAMDVYLNPGPQRWANVNTAYFEDERGPVYIERQQTGTVNGFPVFGEFAIGIGGWKPVHVFISPIPRPFWIPVSRERVLRYRIAEQRQGMRAAGSLTESPYQRWLREAPKRRTEREAVFRSLAGMMRADSLAAFRDAMERTEREVGEGLRRDDSRFMAGAAEGQRHIDRHLADLERELAAMSPSQRASQAWIGGNSLSLLTAAGAPQARRLVAPNPDFYDRTRPATDVQALLVEFVTYSQTPYVLALTGAAFRSLDWAALASFVRP